ncbi:MAG: serine/threonine-protein kinase [Vicinamibacterales bacterium]
MAHGALVIGSIVSHYRVVGRLGTGGMGVVYDAEDLHLSRKVALKFLSEDLASDPDARRRLQREANILARLNHPNICTIYEIAEHEGRPFLVMERLEGTNLKLHIARKVLETAEVVDIAVQVATALAAAHERGIVHRDVKPGNIFVSTSGQTKVLDFGMARSVAQDDSQGRDGSTLPGRPIGTANYMAPERILQMPLDARSDLFSLGVVIYEMATGRLPFAGSTPSDTVTNILDHEATPLTTLAPAHPQALQNVFTALTAKRADERYSSARQVIDVLATMVEPPRRGWRRRLRTRLFSN